MGKEQFSTEYQAGMADGTLVRWEGVVGSVYHAQGGSIIMDVSGVSIFIPASAGDIPEITTVVCALALIASAYLAHAVKAGIVAIGAGQWQAGLSLGFNRWQVLWFVP